MSAFFGRQRGPRRFSEMLSAVTPFGECLGPAWKRCQKGKTACRDGPGTFLCNSDWPFEASWCSEKLPRAPCLLGFCLARRHLRGDENMAQIFRGTLRIRLCRRNCVLPPEIACAGDRTNDMNDLRAKRTESAISVTMYFT